MNILILSDGFSAPAYKPRLRVLCDYLHRQGHAVEVICEQADTLSFEHTYPIHEVALYKGTFADWAIKNTCNMLFQWKERAFERHILQLIKGKTYDVVFCSSFHTFPLRTANNIAARLHVPCVLDLRDMVEQAPANHMLYLKHHAAWLKPFAALYLHRNIRRRNRELCRANAVTTVSPWHADLVKKITSNSASGLTSNSVYTIYNGYDNTLFVPKDTPSDTFRIVYTGKVFPAPQQDPTLLFEALPHLHLSPEKLAVEWYIDPKSEALIRSLARQAGVEPWMHYKGLVQHNRIPALLQEASVCLVLTNTAGPESGHGKMTTKFFEALGVEKPVLCVTSDEECLADVIRDTEAGLSATSAQQVVDFLQDQYAEWQTHGFTHQPIDGHKKGLYARQTQAAQWEKILQEQADHFKNLR